MSTRCPATSNTVDHVLFCLICALSAHMLTLVHFFPASGFVLTGSAPSVETEMSVGICRQKQSAMTRCRCCSDSTCHLLAVCRCFTYAGWRWQSPSANNARSASLYLKYLYLCFLV